jgi:hypothetical protein
MMMIVRRRMTIWCRIGLGRYPLTYPPFLLMRLLLRHSAGESLLLVGVPHALHCRPVYLTNVLIGSRYTCYQKSAFSPPKIPHIILTSIVQYGLRVPIQFLSSCRPDGTSISSHTVSKPASNRSISAT